MSKIADIFALLGLKVDQAQFQKGRSELDKFTRGAQTSGEKVGSVLSGIQTKLIGLAVGFGAAMQARNAFSFRKGLEDLDIASSGAVGSMDSVRDKILEVSDATGVAKETILEGTSAFVALTGDGKAAADSMAVFAKVSAASGAEISDIAGAAAALNQNLGITPDKFEKAFSVLVAGGKAGAIELKEVSALFARLTPAASKFSGGKGIGGLAKISSALQLVRQGAGSASEASTQLESLMRSLTSVNTGTKLKKAGISVFNKDKSIKSLDEIVSEINKKGFRRDKLNDIFGRGEATSAFESLTKVKGAWADLAKKTSDANDVAEDYAKRQKLATQRITKAWNKLKNALTRAFDFLIKGAAFLVEHLNAVVIAFGSLTAALLIYKAASIGAALQSAAAWVLALLPFILLAAGIAAIVLVVEDLWVAFRGGKSVFKDLYLSAKHWIGDMIQGVVDDTVDYLRRKLDFIPGVKGPSKQELMNRRVNEAIQRADRAAERAGPGVAPNQPWIDTTTALKQQDASAEFRNMSVDEVVKRRAQEYSAALRQGGSDNAQVADAIKHYVQSQGLGPNFNAVINVTAGPGHEEIGQAVKREVEGVVRNAAANAVGAN